MNATTKIILAALAVVVIVSGSMYAWKEVSTNSMKREMQQSRAKLTEEMEVKEQNIVKKSGLIVEIRTKRLLRLMATPFLWAVRKEMLKDNYDQIDEYLRQLVKEPDISGIFVSNMDGVILVATDKKNEGKQISEFFPPEITDVDEVRVTAQSPGSMLVSGPVMGINSQIGLMFLLYEPENINTPNQQPD